MKRARLILYLSLITPLLLFSQMKINGVVKDTLEKPVSFANVLLLSMEDDILNGTTTLENGRYQFTIEEAGEYRIKYQYLGYNSVIKTVYISGDVSLDPVILIQNQESLEGVLVKAKIPLIQRKVDRVVFNVDQSMAASGGDAMDALKVTPRLMVRNGRLEMMGKNGMKIMVDGRIKRLDGQELLAFLRSIPSDNIKQIEVLANPPAKYSAEGNSGLVNIVMKKGRSDYWSANLRSNVKKASQFSGGIGANFNYNKDKLSLSASANYTDRNNSPDFQTTIFYPTSIWKENTVEDVNSNALDNIRLVIDYDFGAISTGVSYNRYETNVNAIGRTKTTDRRYMENIDSIIRTIDEGGYDRITHELNYHVIYDIDTSGKELSLDIDLLEYDNDTRNKITSQTFDDDDTPLGPRIRILNDGSQTISNYSANLDMSHPTDFIDLNYGARLVFTETNNSFERDNIENGNILIDSLLTNQFQFKENTQAIYLSGYKKFSDKIDAKIGLRLENTQIEGYSPTLSETNEQKYTKLFPTMYLNYKINEKNSVGVNFGRRISRPSFSYLNPFRWIYSQYSYSEGNPMLRPSFSENLELEYNYKNSWNVTLYYSHLKNGYGRIPFIDSETKIQREIPVNFRTGRMAGVNQYFNISIKNWLETYLQADVYYNSAESEIPEQLSYLDSWNGIFSIRNNLSLNSKETVLFNLSYTYFTEGSDGLNRNEPFSQLNAGFRVYLMKKDLQLNLYANDILRTSKPVFTSYNNNIQYSEQNYFDQQYVRLSVRYDFGGKASGARARSKNSDERNRID